MTTLVHVFLSAPALVVSAVGLSVHGLTTAGAPDDDERVEDLFLDWPTSA